MRLAILGVLLTVVLAPSAVAQDASTQGQICLGGEPTARIQACTWVLENKAFRGKEHIAFYNRANAQLDLGEYARAVADYSEAIRSNRNYTKAYYSRATVYFHMANYRAAIQDYDVVIQRDNNNIGAFHGKGLALAKQGLLDQAIDAFDTAIGLDTEFTAAYSDRGIAFSRLGDHRRAIQDFGSVIRLDPNNVRAYNNRGIAYRNLGNLDRALQEHNQSLELDPNNAETYYNRGIALDQMGEHARAIADFDRAIELNGDESRYFNARGTSRLNNGSPALAVQDFDKATRLNVYNANALNNLALTLATVPAVFDADRSLAMAKRAVKLLPDPRYMNTLALAYVLNGRTADAISTYEKQFRANPDMASRIQDWLSKNGYYGGAIDGEWGTATQGAIERCVQSGCQILIE